jgi:hypothetical protein
MIIIDSSATIPVVARRVALFNEARRGRVCRKFNLVFLAELSEPWFESRRSVMIEVTDD